MCWGEYDRVFSGLGDARDVYLKALPGLLYAYRDGET